MPTDVSSEAAVASLAEAAYEAFGAVHFLMNNAGIGSGGGIEAPLDRCRVRGLGWNLCEDRIQSSQFKVALKHFTATLSSNGLRQV